MAERVLILILIAAAIGLLGLGLRWRSSRYRRPSAADLLHQDARHAYVRAGGVERLAGGKNYEEKSAPALVIAFSTPECVPCRLQQKLALHELAHRYSGRVDIWEVDATMRPELCERFGIMTVPSTVVIDRRGRVTAINHGVARWERLVEQLRLNGVHPPVVHVHPPKVP